MGGRQGGNSPLLCKITLWDVRNSNVIRLSSLICHPSLPNPVQLFTGLTFTKTSCLRRKYCWDLTVPRASFTKTKQLLEKIITNISRESRDMSSRQARKQEAYGDKIQKHIDSDVTYLYARSLFNLLD